MSAAEMLLARIARYLSETEWSADTCDEIADMLRHGGYSVEDIGEELRNE